MARRRRSVTAVTTPFDSCIAAMWAKANTVHLGGTGLLAWPPGLSLCHAERARPPHCTSRYTHSPHTCPPLYLPPHPPPPPPPPPPLPPSPPHPRHHRILLD